MGSALGFLPSSRLAPRRPRAHDQRSARDSPPPSQLLSIAFMVCSHQILMAVRRRPPSAAVEILRSGNGREGSRDAAAAEGRGPPGVEPDRHHGGKRLDSRGRAAPWRTGGASFLGCQPARLSLRRRLPTAHAERPRREALEPTAGGTLYAASPRVDWASLLRRSFEVDVLACASCGGRLRVLGEVTEPAMVRLVLDSLGMPTDAPPRGPRSGPDGVARRPRGRVASPPDWRRGRRCALEALKWVAVPA